MPLAQLMGQAVNSQAIRRASVGVARDDQAEVIAQDATEGPPMGRYVLVSL